MSTTLPSGLHVIMSLNHAFQKFMHEDASLAVYNIPNNGAATYVENKRRRTISTMKK